MSNLTLPQKLGLILVVLGILGTSSAQLTPIVGPGVTQIIVSICTLTSTLTGGILAFLTGQGATVKSVLDMPGVENIDVNSHANQTLAAMAVDPAEPKIGATPAAQQTVSETAKGNV